MTVIDLNTELGGGDDFMTEFAPQEDNFLMALTDPDLMQQDDLCLESKKIALEGVKTSSNIEQADVPEDAEIAEVECLQEDAEIPVNKKSFRRRSSTLHKKKRIRTINGPVALSDEEVNQLDKKILRISSCFHS